MLPQVMAGIEGQRDVLGTCWGTLLHDSISFCGNNQSNPGFSSRLLRRAGAPTCPQLLTLAHHQLESEQQFWWRCTTLKPHEIEKTVVLC